MKKLICSAIVLASAAVFAGGYKKYVEVTASGYSGSELADFPVLVKVSNAKLPGFSTDIRNSGKDVKFTSADGSTVYPHELDTYSAGGVSMYWVKIPEFKQDVKFRMYYGNESVTVSPDPKPVWTGADCLMVMHFNSDLKESAKGYTGHDYGTLSGVVAGPCGNAYNISTGNESSMDGGIVLEGSEGLDHGNSFTITYWAKHVKDQTIATREGVLQNRPGYFDYNKGDKAAPGFSLGMRTEAGGDMAGYNSYVNHIYVCPAAQGKQNDGNWHHFAIAFDGNGGLITRRNAVNVQSITGSLSNLINSPNCPMVIGGSPAFTGNDCTGVGGDNDIKPWKGAFDEMRIYKGSTPLPRLDADYGTMVSDYCTFGTPVEDTSEATSALMIF